jgi:hypothetical protein
MPEPKPSRFNAPEIRWIDPLILRKAARHKRRGPACIRCGFRLNHKATGEYCLPCMRALGQIFGDL